MPVRKFFLREPVSAQVIFKTLRSDRACKALSLGEVAGDPPGGPMRAIFDVMGIRNIVAKSHGSSNPYNMVRATLDALSKLRSPSEIAAKRGKTVEELIG